MFYLTCYLLIATKKCLEFTKEHLKWELTIIDLLWRFPFMLGVVYLFVASNFNWLWLVGFVVMFLNDLLWYGRLMINIMYKGYDVLNFLIKNIDHIMVSVTYDRLLDREVIFKKENSFTKKKITRVLLTEEKTLIFWIDDTEYHVFSPEELYGTMRFCVSSKHLDKHEQYDAFCNGEKIYL